MSKQEVDEKFRSQHKQKIKKIYKKFKKKFDKKYIGYLMKNNGYDTKAVTCILYS